MFKMFELFISGLQVPQPTELCARLRQNKRTATVSETQSIVENLFGGYVHERGARVLFSDSAGLREGWEIFAAAYHLKCAYVVTHNFRGCIHDFLNESRCPGKKRKPVRSSSSPPLRS